jgi:RimJ/RimL family protein N-acetyltransferase
MILQPILSDHLVVMEPLEEKHFEDLYLIASDPLIWEQHPNRERYKREVFRKYFDDGLASEGALIVKRRDTMEIIGCSWYYELKENEVAIGYTFVARAYWGHTYNRSMKKLMLDHAFQYVDTVIFHIGANNIRSQTAIGKLGAQKIGEQRIDFPGEPNPLNFVYAMTKERWLEIS